MTEQRALTTRCPNCNGKRFLMGQGGFRKECYYCNGTGRIEKTVGDVREDLIGEDGEEGVETKKLRKGVQKELAAQKRKAKKTKKVKRKK